MPIGQARKLVHSIDDLDAITERTVLQKHLAALSKVFGDEVARRQAFTRITLPQMLLNAGGASRGRMAFESSQIC